MRRSLRWIIPAAVFFLLALVARGTSMGMALDRTARTYLDALAAGDGDGAYSMLSDSLKVHVSPGLLEGLQGLPGSEAILAGGMEDRGLSMTAPLPGGGSRTLWMTEGDNGWRVSGDTSLDNLLGAASLSCIRHARETVIPAMATGSQAEDFICPVSGLAYAVSDSRLVCPSGHLGEGLDLAGDACRGKRESVAETVAAWMSSGAPLPESLASMYEASGGDFGQRGGYRCPDNGYSYYEITDQGIWCPFHDQTSIIPLPPDALPQGVGAGD